MTIDQAKHPYRSAIDGLRAAENEVRLGGDPATTFELIDYIRRTVDVLGFDLQTREWVSDLVDSIVRNSRSIRVRFQNAQKNAEWSAGAIGGVGVLLQLTGFRYGWLGVCASVGMVVVARLIFSMTTRWLRAADELDKLADEIRKALPSLPKDDKAVKLLERMEAAIKGIDANSARAQAVLDRAELSTRVRVDPPVDSGSVQPSRHEGDSDATPSDTSAMDSGRDGSRRGGGGAG